MRCSDQPTLDKLLLEYSTGRLHGRYEAQGNILDQLPTRTIVICCLRLRLYCGTFSTSSSSYSTSTTTTITTTTYSYIPSANSYSSFYFLCGHSFSSCVWKTWVNSLFFTYSFLSVVSLQFVQCPACLPACLLACLPACSSFPSCCTGLAYPFPLPPSHSHVIIL